MKDTMKKLTKAFVTAGVACLLLGIVGYTQPARGGLVFSDGDVWVSVSGTDHYSYGQWEYGYGWLTGNTQDSWSSGYAYFTCEWGWSALVLYSLYHSWNEEVLFLYDVDY